MFFNLHGSTAQCVDLNPEEIKSNHNFNVIFFYKNKTFLQNLFLNKQQDCSYQDKALIIPNKF